MSFVSRRVQVPPRLNDLLILTGRGDGRGSERVLGASLRSLPWMGVGGAGRQRRMLSIFIIFQVEHACLFPRHFAPTSVTHHNSPPLTSNQMMLLLMLSFF